MKALVLSLMTAVCLFTAPASAADSIYKKTVLGTAMVVTTDGRGTGWVIDREKKQMVTCEHVIGKNREVKIW